METKTTTDLEQLKAANPPGEQLQRQLERIIRLRDAGMIRDPEPPRSVVGAKILKTRVLWRGVL